MCKLTHFHRALSRGYYYYYYYYIGKSYLSMILSTTQRELEKAEPERGRMPGDRRVSEVTYCSILFYNHAFHSL